MQKKREKYRIFFRTSFAGCICSGAEGAFGGLIYYMYGLLLPEARALRQLREGEALC